MRLSRWWPAPALFVCACAAQRFADALTIGERVSVSVFASSDGGDSAHEIHRNAQSEDGAIVVDPTGPSPKWLLFRFQNQTF